jgi:hypothetical protein
VAEELLFRVELLVDLDPCHEANIFIVSFRQDKFSINN